MAEMEPKRVAVVGAGVMGHGIAQVAASAGCRTVLHDVDPDQLSRGLDRIAEDLEGGVVRGKIEAGEKERALELLSSSTDLGEAVADADLVIEAIPEKLDLKIEILGRVAAVAPRAAILATNTSSLPVTQIAASLEGPDRVIGLHFFNPPPRMPLLEVVRAEQTSSETVEAALEIGSQFGKETILVGDSPGFATSRLGLVIGLEAMRMVETGVASVADIDRAMERGYRHPMGPLRLTDLVGLDVRLGIAEHLHAELGEVFRPPAILRRMVRAGFLGRKSGRGFYIWDEEGPREAR